MDDEHPDTCTCWRGRLGNEMIDVRTLKPPDKEDIRALLADWPEPDFPYIAVNKRWLVSRDGRIWEYHARGTNHIPGNPASGVWCENMVIAWTGQWRETADGHRRQCTTGIPMPHGMDIAELLKAKGVYRPELDIDMDEPAPPPEFDQAIIARREPARVEELAKQGIKAAEEISQYEQAEEGLQAAIDECLAAQPAVGHDQGDGI